MSQVKHPLWGTVGSASVETAGYQRYLVMPSPADPRLVIPTRPRRSSATLLRALRDRTSLKARAQTLAISGAALVNARTQELPTPTLFEVVARALGRTADDVVVGVHIGPPRANRKPVLAVADRTGHLIAFAKYGVNALTDELVSHEARALQQLGLAAQAGVLEHCTVPELIASGRHDDHEYAIQSPIPTSAPPSARKAEAAAVVAAQTEVAAMRPVSGDQQSFLQAVLGRWAERVSGSDDDVVRRFADLATQWADLAESSPLTWGSWHGDWRPTNMAVIGAGCSVWDWERFASGVPVGFDALHLFLTTRLPSVRDVATVPHDVVENAPRLLRPFGVSERTAAELTVVGYFLELAGRYLDDDQAGAGGRLGRVGDWLLPALTEFVRERTATPGGTHR